MSATSISTRTSPADSVRSAIQSSDFLKGLSRAQAAFANPRGFRALTPAEIKTLQSLHNAAESWDNVFVAENFNPNKVVGCYFTGKVWLGSFSEKVAVEPGVLLGSGVYNCELQNVYVGNDAHLCNTDLIANVYIGPRAVVRGCGSVLCVGQTAFGNGQSASLGLETFGRETAFYTEITSEIAAQIAAYRKKVDVVQSYNEAVAEYARRASSSISVIEAGAIVRNTQKIVNSYIGPGAQIDSAAWIENSTLLCTPDEPVHVLCGSSVRDSILQWSVRIDNQAHIEQSICCECSSVDDHGQLRRSLLGPNSGVSAGECINSLVGPFVGFHHQSLLIAAYWPGGKGNIAYGANIGSNHTSKQADQEIWPGEGLFFGLGVNIKFPADFSRAPYTIIASGVSTLPQRVEMPFSLINIRAESIEGVSPAYNEIIPGWMLADNIYAVRRSERKYATRNKAKRSHCDFEVFRPEIVDLMIRARAALQKVENTITPAKVAVQKGAAMRPVYTDKDIPGLGKNFMKETARQEGISAYTFYIRLYALKGLYFAMRFCRKASRDIGKILEPGYIGDPRYEHELALLRSEFPEKSLRELLGELITATDKMTADMLLAKEKDNFRGVRIIPDYAEIHIPASEDPLIKATQQESAELRGEVEKWIEQL